MNRFTINDSLILFGAAFPDPILPTIICSISSKRRANLFHQAATLPFCVQKNMKPFLAFLFLVFLAQWPLRGEDSPHAPIIVQINRDSLLQPTINGKSMNLIEAKRFLEDLANRFGTKDPVIIQLDENQGMDVAVILLEIAHKSHDQVFLAVRSLGSIYHIAIPKDGIKSVRPANVNPKPMYIPKENDMPNRRGEEQLQKLLDIQQNKIK